MKLSNRIMTGVYLLVSIVVIGTAGYIFIEHWTFLDSLYMTIITITTVGYREVGTLDTAGRIFTIFLIIGGVGGAFYTLTNVMVYIVEAEFGVQWRRRRMEAKIARMRGHFIVCGYGRVGQVIAHTFRQENEPFVLIEENAEAVSQAEEAGFLVVKGDASSDESLKAAGIEHARGLVAAVGDDATNTYIALSAREVRPDIFIEARASGRSAEAKLKKAGADRTISPHNIGAHRMAMLALRPAVVDFIDTVTSSHGREFQMENIAVGKSSTLAGLNVAEIRKRTGATILAISKKSGRLLPNPPDEEVIGEGDHLILIGLKEKLAAVDGSAEKV